MNSTQQAFYSRAELSSMFRVTTQTVIRWEQAGLLTSVHFASGSVRYSRQSVEQFIAQQTEARPTKGKETVTPTYEQTKLWFNPVRLMRFWAKVNKRADGCWIWTGALTDTGHGRYNFDGDTVRVHRLIVSRGSWRGSATSLRCLGTSPS